MDVLLIDRIFQLNPWLRIPGCYREHLDVRLPRVMVPRRAHWPGDRVPPSALLLVGPRQAGKSTFLWSILRAREPAGILYLNGEEPLVRSWCSSAAGFMDDLSRHFPGVRTIFLDEAQHLDEAGLFVKGLIDARRGLEVLVTGSSSFTLMSRTRESLAGRALRRSLLPFSLSEIRASEGSISPTADRSRAIEVRRRQQVWGSYPDVWFAPDPAAVLSDLVDALILRDASDLFRVGRPDAFRRLLQLLAGQVGSMLNLAELAGLLGISAPTVREYVGLLEETWIVRLLPPFVGGRRAEITRAARVHFFDMGLRNRLLGHFDQDLGRRADRGALAEGWVFSEIMKTLPQSWELRYWRAKGGAEMDFVLTDGSRVIGVEVKAGDARMSRSAHSFIETFCPEAVLLVGENEARQESLMGGTRVVRLPMEDLGDEVEALTRSKYEPPSGGESEGGPT